MSVLFEVKRQYTDPPDTPYVKIIDISDKDIFEKIRGHFDLTGFELYHDKIDEFSCNSIYLEFYTYNLTRQTPIFPQLDAIRNKENIESLDFRCPNISPEFKRDIFYEFENVKKLTANYKHKKKLPKLFPNLEAYSAGSAWQNNPLNSLGDAWPKLKYLDLRMFRGDLKIFAGRDIRRIFLTARKIMALMIFPFSLI